MIREDDERPDWLDKVMQEARSASAFFVDLTHPSKTRQKTAHSDSVRQKTLVERLVEIGPRSEPLRA